MKFVKRITFFTGLVIICAGIYYLYLVNLDYNCSDFQTHEEAQNFYLSHGGPTTDKYHLDANHNGVACESLR